MSKLSLEELLDEAKQLHTRVVYLADHVLKLAKAQGINDKTIRMP